MSRDSGAGGRPWCYDRGVSGGPPEPQLERPEGCALPEGEGIPGTTAGQPSDVSVEECLKWNEI